MYPALQGLANSFPQLLHFPMVQKGLNMLTKAPSWQKAITQAAIGEAVNKSVSGVTNIPETLGDVGGYIHTLYKGHPRNFIAGAAMDVISELPWFNKPQKEIFIEDAPEIINRIKQDRARLNNPVEER